MSVTVALFGDFVASKSVNLTLSEEVRSIITSSDIAVCNFEAPVEGDFKPFDRGGPLVKQSSKAPALLKDWGFNLVQLANNHMLDFGDAGCTATLDAFSDIQTVGAGTFDKAYSIETIEIKGQRIGFISCVHHEFGVWETENSSQRNGTAWICHHLMRSRIAAAKNSVDFLIVLPHAGIEEIDAPLPEWRELYRCFIDWGADAVIGTHPHVPQGWEEYKGKPIYYSLGNFYFDFLTGHHPFWNRSLVVLLEINEDGSVKHRIKNIAFMNNAIFIDSSNDTIQHNRYICELLNDEASFTQYINEQSRLFWEDYRNLLARGIGAIPLGLRFKEMLKTTYVSIFRGRQRSFLENCLQCESHRWMILRAQKFI